MIMIPMEMIESIYGNIQYYNSLRLSDAYMRR